jgi:chromosome segregation protein
MHIRKLELQGFKSFPDRTAFHFAPGVSGVVGPNGCGKSNVVDAVKWCLGEQSAKSLRGRSMEDIIFAGSQTRNALGIAEVSLTFTAGEEPFAGEFARCEEIQITRRLFRDGHSEYLINQTRCRLKDIQDIFRDTGASNRMYSFIEQGRIGEIVKAKPEQRRTLIEEAAGISRFKAKKREAELRLEGTNRNLERATDLVEDLTGRLRSLKRQVTKATRYRSLRTEVRQGEIYLGLSRYAALAADRKALSERLRTSSTTEEAKLRELERQESGILEAREAVDVLDSGVGVLRDQLGDLEATRREQESARLYQGRESEQLLERIERLGASRLQAEADLKVSSERRSESQAEHDKVLLVASTANETAEAAATVAADAEKTVQARRAEIDDAKSLVLDMVRSLARDRASKEAARQRRIDVEERLADLDFRIQVAKDASGDSEDAMKQAHVAAEAAQLECDKALSVQVASEAQWKRQRELLNDARVARRESETALVAAERQSAQANARLESLEALQAAHDGVEEHARRALQVDGVLGTLADHLDVPEELEPLVATALGDELEYVLVPDVATAMAVAQATQGRISMLLVGDDSPDGALRSVASDEVGTSALARVLGSCTEVDSLETALECHQRDGGVFLVREGDNGLPILVTARGEIRIGPASTGATIVLQRRREISQLREQAPSIENALGAAQAAVEEAASRQEAVREAGEAAQAAYDLARGRLGEAQVVQRTAASEKARVYSQQSDRGKQLASLEQEQSKLKDLQDSLGTQHQGLSETIDSVQSAQIEHEERLQVHQSQLVEEERIARDLRQKAVVSATELSGVKQRLQGLAQLADAARQAEEGSARQVASCQLDIERAKGRINDLAESDQDLMKTLQSISEEQASLRSKIEEAKATVQKAREDLRLAEESIRGLRDEREAATAARMETERHLDQVKTDIAHIRAQLVERYQVSVTALLDRMERNGQLMIEVPEEARQHLVESEDSEASESAVEMDEGLEDLCIKPSMLENETLIGEWVERLSAAKKRLDRLGEVNLVAVQEYAEVKERYDTLEAQRQDLEESVRAIRHSIAQLNRTCRERFRETFDRVNALFQEGYPRLVGGGMARLVLTDEEDMLETGVDIEVQPPGKRLQNMSLLSGGEMAMTAIALIFALFQVKPSPFCLLDEVDAPLDEANGARFNNLLREMAKLSQFIVITHNKKTMECVDTLYGVTMQNPGVSRLVSVNLD